MSTQHMDATEFSIAHEFTNFRLVELPDELLQLLTDHNTPTLELKSEASSSHAVLCTESKTFPIRSVQTSNSLFVIHPVIEQGEDEDGIPNHGVRAIASCGATMELTKSTESPLPYLRKALPVYSSRDLDTSAAARTSFKLIAEDIPLSRQEIRDAWSELCAFEETGASFRPTAGILLDLWKAIHTASVVENLDLSSAFLVDDLWKAIKDDEFPRGMFGAVLDRIEDSNSMEVDTDSKWTTIDKGRCSAWVAALILETQTPADQTLKVSDFLDTWRNNLFESWRAIPGLSIVQNITTQPTPSTITLKPEHRLAGMPAIVLQAAEAKAPTKARKWHEKFRKSRP